MSQKESISYKLYSEYLTATGYLDGEESKITYVEHQDVRAAAMALMEVLLAGYEKEIFSQVCGCCGQCCINRTVLLNALEIVTVSHHLDISETVFRESYLMPAATWNEHDGALALKDEKCVFLEQGSSGIFKCAIYQARPSFCREIMPEPECGKKDPGKLLTHVERLEIEPQALTCHLTSGSYYLIEQRTPELQDALRKLHEVAYPCLGMKQSQLDQMSGDAHRLLDWLLNNHKAGVSPEVLLPRFSAVKEIIEDLDTLTLLHEKDPEDLEQLWSKVRHLNELFGSADGKGTEAAIEKAGSCREEVPVDICFQPTALSVKIKSQDKPLATTLDYQQHGRLLDLVREFLEALVASGEPGLVDVLGHTDPYCFMCGVCCGSYDLEATAADIERLADYLKISEKEVWEKHLVPGSRSWNRRDGLLRRLEKEGHEGECVFLKAKSQTESVCGIYEGRPQICRDYQANTRLCQKQSLLLRGYEHIGNIISCQAADDIVRITTRYTHSQNKEPFVIPLKYYDRLREMFHKVKREVLQILDTGSGHPDIIKSGDV
ncbi:MAG: YkgJ family cysteine cluster protein [Candidatus Eremiobacteraeota bacterium]|nr:YkgJ family cysteine cluster protein [Candidatus Eremiobacteraeota bacterium]